MLFLSTFTNRIDKKGRVSVPASFRAALAGEGFPGIVAYTSLSHTCIEASGMARITKLNAYMETLPPFSDERDALAAVVFGESVQLPFDPEGRVSLPEQLVHAAGISAEAVFVGKGETFEIWSPKAHADYVQRARKLVKDVRTRLGAPPQGGKA